MLQTISQISAKERVHKAVMKAVKSHVLLVENDSQLAQLIAQELGCEGYQVNLTEDGISESYQIRLLETTNGCDDTRLQSE